MTLGNKLQTLRKQKGLSQEQLAEQLGVSRQAVSKWELNTTLPETENILQLSRLFYVSSDYLLKDEIEQDIRREVQEESGKKKLKLFFEKYGYIIAYGFSAVSLYCFLGYIFILLSCMNPTFSIKGFTYVGNPAKWFGRYGLIVYYIVLALAGTVTGRLAGKKLERKSNPETYKGD